MREALAGLTTRGRAFVAAGVTAVVCAVLLGQPALTRVGVLVTAVPLVTTYVLGRARYRLALVRTVTPQVVPAGQPAQVHLDVTNEGRTPSGVLLLEDRIPYVLGSRPRFVLDGIRHGWRRRVGYQVRSDVRGRFEIGPMTVRVSDPFGMVEVGRAFHSITPLVVTPRVVPLPVVPLEGAWNGSGDNRPRAFAGGSAEDVTVREYRQGDDLRRVHWRSSARMGELMVRREEQPWQQRATVFLDQRIRAHAGQGLASSLEAAVQAAASVVVHLTDRGYAVRLVTASGEEEVPPWHARGGRGSDSLPLLEALAVVQPSDHLRIDTSWMAEHGRGDLVVAVLGAVADTDLAVLRRVHGHASAAVAVVLDVLGWASARGSDRSAAEALAAQGWRTTGWSHGERLDVAWERLGARPGAARVAGGAHLDAAAGATGGAR